MLFCSKLENHTGILLVLLGQFFLVIGLIAVICNRKAKPYPCILLVFPLAGIIMIAGTLGKIRYLKQVCTQEIQAKNTKNNQNKKFILVLDS